MTSVKQKVAFKEVTENHRSVSDAMRVAGYSLSSATKPKNLTETKGWKEMLDKYLPDDDLAQVHREGLFATKLDHSPTEPDKEVVDHPTRHRFLETAYRLKKNLGPDTLQQFNVGGDMSLEF